MDRREFIKSAILVSAMAPLVKIAKAADAQASDTNNGKVTRRRYKETDLTLPLLGYGMMRLPTKNDAIDYAEVRKQIKIALEHGVNYFDTAYFYHGGKSENAAGDILSEYPRDKYMLTDKMPVRILKTEADTDRIFNEQLSKCKTPYFDFYLLHALNKGSWENAKRLKVWEYLRERQKEGKIKKLGFSFHDSPEVLKEIASSHDWDFAQIQLNYFDWKSYRSKEQYEILTERNIPVIVMEPLKGGTLANLTPEATEVLKKANPDATIASWAFRWVGSLPNVLCILSGMTETKYLDNNIATFTDFKPLNETERSALDKALSIYRSAGGIPCTGCRYCLPCPAGVEIPTIFSLYNQLKATNDKAKFQREYAKLDEDARPSSCVNCQACMKKCPQHIRIPEMMKKIEAEISKL